MAGLSKESNSDFCSLSQLLFTLPYPSRSHGQVEAISVSDAREWGLISEASKEALAAFSYCEMKLYKHVSMSCTLHVTVMWQIYAWYMTVIRQTYALYITCIYLTYDWYMINRTVWLLFLSIQTTFAIVVPMLMLNQPFLTQTVCGLYVGGS